MTVNRAGIMSHDVTEKTDNLLPVQNGYDLFITVWHSFKNTPRLTLHSVIGANLETVHVFTTDERLHHVPSVDNIPVPLVIR